MRSATAARPSRRPARFGNVRSAAPIDEHALHELRELNADICGQPLYG